MYRETIIRLLAILVIVIGSIGSIIIAGINAKKRCDKTARDLFDNEEV